GISPNRLPMVSTGSLKNCTANVDKTKATKGPGIFWQKFSQKIPGPLVALVLSTLAVQFLRLPVETIGSRFGEIPHLIPHPVIPNVNLETIIPLIPSIFSITLLGGIESLLSAVV